jgi:hypothetical protein
MKESGKLKARSRVLPRGRQVNATDCTDCHLLRRCAVQVAAAVWRSVDDVLHNSSGLGRRWIWREHVRDRQVFILVFVLCCCCQVRRSFVDQFVLCISNRNAPQTFICAD